MPYAKPAIAIPGIPAPTDTTWPGVHRRNPLSPEPNPRLVFERLFGVGAPSERAENLKLRQQEQQSILDFVMEDASAIQRKLNGRDRQKLDQYLTSVREIEQRIERAERIPVANPAVDAPAGIPPNFEEHIALMFDMLILAFQTDSTRVATMLLAGEGSNRTFTEIGLSEGTTISRTIATSPR
jgi:hypothetical protein